MDSTWERGPDGGYSGMIQLPGHRFRRSAHAWPVRGGKWMAGLIGNNRVAGPVPSLTAAKQAAERLVREAYG